MFKDIAPKDMCEMINNLQHEKLIYEIKDLVNCIDSVKDEINIYCDLMKQIFLSGSNEN